MKHLKAFSVLLLVGLVGCSNTPTQPATPLTKTVVVEAGVIHPPLPDPVIKSNVRFDVITSLNFEEKKTKSDVYICLTPASFSDLSTYHLDVFRYINQTKSLLCHYRAKNLPDECNDVIRPNVKEK